VSATEFVTVGDVAIDCAERLDLALVYDDSIAIGIVEVRRDGIYVHPDSLHITLADQTRQSVMFDPTVKAKRG
jgi:hypothetical protein